MLIQMKKHFAVRGVLRMAETDADGTFKKTKELLSRPG